MNDYEYHLQDKKQRNTYNNNIPAKTPYVLTRLNKTHNDTITLSITFYQRSRLAADNLSGQLERMIGVRVKGQPKELWGHICSGRDRFQHPSVHSEQPIGGRREGLPETKRTSGEQEGCDRLSFRGRHNGEYAKGCF